MTILSSKLPEPLLLPYRSYTWVKVHNFQNPEFLKLAVRLSTSTITSLNGQLSLDKLKLNQRSN